MGRCPRSLFPRDKTDPTEAGPFLIKVRISVLTGDPLPWYLKLICVTIVDYAMRVGTLAPWHPAMLHKIKGVNRGLQNLSKFYPIEKMALNWKLKRGVRKKTIG